MFKKLAIAFAGLILLFVIAAIAVPMFVDVDKFRPQIVQTVNQHINGDFKLGKLQLSLWSGVEVNIESLSIQAQGASKPLLETTSAHLEIPFLSIISMSPEINVVLESPKVDVIKAADGKINLMALMKETPPGQPTPPPAQATSSSSLPGIVAGASLGFKLKKGVFTYTDHVTGSKYAVNGADLSVKNLGMKKTIEIAVALPIQGSSPTMSLNGEVQANAKITPVFDGVNFRSASGHLDVDASQLSFVISHGTLDKSSQMPMTMKLDFEASTSEFQIKNLDAKFSELALNVKGLIQLKPAMSLKMDIHTAQLDMGSLAAIVPMLKSYGLGGVATLDVHAEGPTDHLGVHGDLTVKGGKAAYPAMLKGPVSYDLKSAFTENSLHLSELTATGPGLAAELKGSIENLKAPQFNFALNAKQINVDQLLKQDSSTAKKTAAFFDLSILPQAEAAPKHAAKRAAKPAPHHITAAPIGNTGNPMLAMAKNPMIANASGTFTANIAQLIAKGATITNVSSKVTLKNMFVDVESASLKAFNGTMNAKATADLKSPGLNFKSTGDVKGLDIKGAMVAFVPKFQNTMEGTVNATWNMTGAAYPKEAMMHSLNATIHMDAQNGKLHTMDIGNAIKSSLSKVSFLQGKSLPNISQNFKSMRAEIKMAGGVINADPLELIGDSQGVNVKGKSMIREDMTQDTYIDVYDPNRLLPKEVSNGKDAALQLHITGPVSSPQTDYGYTVGRLAKNVIKNQGTQMLGNQIKKLMGGAGGGASSGSGSGDMVNKALKGLGF